MHLTKKIFFTSLGMLTVIGCAQLIKKSTFLEYTLQGERLDRRPASLRDTVRKLDPTKKTVCTITINSEDEKNVFTKNLEKQNFNFIELTNFEGPRSDWFLNACQSGVQCDVVLISGHFGGQFFGSSGLFLSLENLESYACQNVCDGILKNPKEVFLFGCNTLAGKRKDHRTQAEYVRVLMNDGFNRSDAERVAAFRYSPFGHTNESRMRRAFKGAQKLYGFDAVAPSGANIRGSIDAYLKKVGNYNMHLQSIRPEKKNEALASVLNWAPFVEFSGWGDVSLSPTCYLESPKVETIDKLKWIKNIFANPQEGLQNATFIHQYLSQQQEAGVVWTTSEKKIIEDIRNSNETKETIEKILENKVLGLLSVETSMASLMHQIGWWNSSRFNSWTEKNLNSYFRDSLSRTQIDEICSSGLALDFVPTQLPENPLQWSYSTLEVVSCLQPSHPNLAKKLLTIVRQHNDEKYRTLSAQGLHHISQVNAFVRNELINILESESHDQVISQIETVLKISRNISSEQLQVLKKIIQTPQPFHRPVAALSIIKASHPSDPSLAPFLVDIMTSTNPAIEGLTKIRAADALSEIPLSDPAIIDRLINIIKGSAEYYVKYGAANVLNGIPHLTEESQQRLVDIVKTESDITSRIGGLIALEKSKPLKDSLKLQLEQALQFEHENVVRQRITALLK